MKRPPAQARTDPPTDAGSASARLDRPIHAAPAGARRGSGDTVAIAFVRSAVARLTPADRRAVLAQAGIAPALLAADAARVSAAAFSALWLAVADRLDDEFFGLDRRRMKRGSFALLCHALLAAPTLGDALRLMLRGFGTLLDDVGARLHVEGTEAVVQIDNRIAEAEARRFADETLLVLVHGLMCWLVGRRVTLAEAAFAHPRPPHAQEYVAMYARQLRFDRPATAIRFPARRLELPVVQDLAGLHRLLRSAPQSVFVKYRNAQAWSARLRRRMRGCPASGDWPGLDEVAREFGVAPATLRRHLEAEETSFRSIRDALRLDAAIHALDGGTESIAEVAARLGFREPSAFHRAFRKWCGVAPGEYRRARGRPPERP